MEDRIADPCPKQYCGLAKEVMEEVVSDNLRREHLLLMETLSEV